MSALTSGLRMTAIAALAICMNAAIAQPSSSGAAPSGTRGGTEPGSVPSASARQTVDTADKKMMMELAQANFAEIESAKLAENQTKNPEVLAFARKMIEDHTQASKDLAQLAQSKSVTLPQRPDSKHIAMAKKLAKVNGEKFDKQYMAHSGVDDHRATVALLKRIESRAADPDLKALAGKLLPTVEQHLDMAQGKKKL